MENFAHQSTGKARAVFSVALFLILAGGAGYLWLQHQHATSLNNVLTESAGEVAALRSTAETVAIETASDATGAIAGLIAEDVMREDYERVEAALAAVVRGNRVMSVLVMDQDGRVVVATDQRFAGRTLDDPATRLALAADRVSFRESGRGPGELVFDAPLDFDGQRVGMIRLFVDLSPFFRRIAAE